MLRTALAVAVLTAGCSERTVPTTPTPVDPTITESFTGTVAVGGSDTHAFDVHVVGGLKVTLTSVEPQAEVVIGIGTVSGATCTVVQSEKVLPGPDPQLSGTATQIDAPFCILVSDPGALTAPVTYAVTVIHS